MNARRRFNRMTRVGMAQLNRLRKRGSQVYCPCCETWQRDFRALVMPDRQCWVCGSLERHRLLSFLFDIRPELLRPSMSILHVAPEPQVAPRVRRAALRYVSGDLNAEFGPERLNLLHLPFADREFDAVVCNHVLEHIPDDQQAIREIHRVLRPGAWAILLVPDVTSLRTVETPDITDPDEMLRLYGQRDHVRRYGWDYLDRLRDSGLEPEVVRFQQILSSETIRTCRLLKFGEVEPVFLARRTSG